MYGRWNRSVCVCERETRGMGNLSEKLENQALNMEHDGDQYKDVKEISCRSKIWNTEHGWLAGYKNSSNKRSLISTAAPLMAFRMFRTV